MSSPLPPGAPEPSPAEGEARLRPLPWDDRALVGPVPALLQTAELMVLRPREGFLRARRRGDVLSPTLWVLAVVFLGELAQLAWSTAVGLPLRTLLGRSGGLPPLLFATEGGLFPLVFGPLAAAAGAFVLAGILHACLALVGGLDRSVLGYEGSLRAVGYGYTAQLALIVPLVGRVIAFLWMLPLVALGLSVLHDTTFGRALAAVLIPLLACCLCGVAISLLFGAAVAGLLGSELGLASLSAAAGAG